MIALVIAAAAAMSGPRTTAFADRCAELKKDDAALVCTRLKRTSSGGHAVEVWETSSHVDFGDGEEAFDRIAIYVAMRDTAGWYLSDSIVGFQTFHENGHHNAGGAVSIDHLDARALRVGGKPGVRVRTVEALTGFCTPCEPASQNTLGFTVEQATCVLDAAGPQCDVLDPDTMTTNVAISSSVVMTGPRTTAFAATCAELRANTPDLECKRLGTLRGDHPVEVWATTTPRDATADAGAPTSQVFVTIQTNRGWFLGGPMVPGSDDDASASVIDRIDTSLVRAGGRRAVRVDFVHGSVQDHPGATLTLTCTADDSLIPQCNTTADGQ